MKNTSKRLLALAFSAIMSASLFVSCGSGTDDREQIAALQLQLDSTMAQYQRLKSNGGDFEKQLSSRDSAINAQAVEIQRLIDELNAAKRRPAASSSDEKARLERQQKEIREKENTIRQLQKQIDQQKKQISELKKSAGSGTHVDANQEKQINTLQAKIAEQQKQIASLQKETNRLKDQNTSEGKENDKVRKDYDSKIASMNSQLDNYKSQIAELNEQIKAKNEEIARLGKSANTNAAENAELVQMRSQVAELNKQVTELSKKEADCRARCNELEKSSTSGSGQWEAEKRSLQTRINNLGDQVKMLQSQTDDLQRQNVALDSENSNLKSENARLRAGGDNQLNQTINELNTQVEAQRLQIAQLQSDLQQKDRELEAAKKNSSSKGGVEEVNRRLEELQILCDSYLQEIERLRAENEQLKSENDELKDRVAGSSDLYAENERLRQKVKLASVLVTTDLKVTPGKSLKTGNVVKSTTKAKQTKVVRIDCRILDNNVVDPGSITIYARIANAANRVVCNGLPESFDMSGAEMQYTLKQDIEFTGYGRTLAMIWKKADDVELAPGLYWVTLYAGGYEIGKTSFKLD